MDCSASVGLYAGVAGAFGGGEEGGGGGGDDANDTDDDDNAANVDTAVTARCYSSKQRVDSSNHSFVCAYLDD